MSFEFTVVAGQGATKSMNEIRLPNERYMGVFHAILLFHLTRLAPALGKPEDDGK